jgi:hypothetical protein
MQITKLQYEWNQKIELSDHLLQEHKIQQVLLNLLSEGEIGGVRAHCDDVFSFDVFSNPFHLPTFRLFTS